MFFLTPECFASAQRASAVHQSSTRLLSALPESALVRFRPVSVRALTASRIQARTSRRLCSVEFIIGATDSRKRRHLRVPLVNALYVDIVPGVDNLHLFNARNTHCALVNANIGAE